MAVVFISHDLGAVSQICERVSVMYAGRIVEQARTEALLPLRAIPIRTACLIPFLVSTVDAVV